MELVHLHYYLYMELLMQRNSLGKKRKQNSNDAFQVEMSQVCAGQALSCQEQLVLCILTPANLTIAHCYISEQPEHNQCDKGSNLNHTEEYSHHPPPCPLCPQRVMHQIHNLLFWLPHYNAALQQ